MFKRKPYRVVLLGIAATTILIVVLLRMPQVEEWIKGALLGFAISAVFVYGAYKDGVEVKGDIFTSFVLGLGTAIVVLTVPIGALFGLGGSVGFVISGVITASLAVISSERPDEVPVTEKLSVREILARVWEYIMIPMFMIVLYFLFVVDFIYDMKDEIAQRRRR